MSPRLLIVLVVAMLAVAMPALATPSGIFTDDDGGAVDLPSGRTFAMAVLSTGWSFWPNGVPAVDTIAGWVHGALGFEPGGRYQNQ